MPANPFESQPTEIPPVLGMRKADLRPEVRSLADNLYAQIRNIYDDYGVKNVAELDQKMRDGEIDVPLKEAEKLKELLNMLKQVMKTGERPLEYYRQEESKKLSAFFEKEIEVPLLPAAITPERIKNWEQLGLELHYLPAENMTKDRELKAWKNKPGDWFYEQIAQGTIPATATELPEAWFVIDGRQKPAYNKGSQMYEHDPLASALEELNIRGIISQTNFFEIMIDHKSRFGLSPADFDKPEVIKAIARALDLDPNQTSLPETMVWNLMANIHHPEWGTTNTYEWLKERYRSGERLISGGSSRGGASSVGWSGEPDAGTGFRPLGRFSA